MIISENVDKNTFKMYISMRYMTMQAINFTTARNELASVLDSISSGEPVIITRRSAKPVSGPPEKTDSRCILK